MTGLVALGSAFPHPKKQFYSARHLLTTPLDVALSTAFLSNIGQCVRKLSFYREDSAHIFGGLDERARKLLRTRGFLVCRTLRISVVSQMKNPKGCTLGDCRTIALTPPKHTHSLNVEETMPWICHNDVLGAPEHALTDWHRGRNFHPLFLLRRGRRIFTPHLPSTPESRKQCHTMTRNHGSCQCGKPPGINSSRLLRLRVCFECVLQWEGTKILMPFLDISTGPPRESAGAFSSQLEGSSALAPLLLLRSHSQTSRPPNPAMSGGEE